MGNKVLKEDSRLASKINSIEEMMEVSKLSILIGKTGRKRDKGTVILKSEDRYFLFISDEGKIINEFPPQVMGKFYLCNENGDLL